MATPTSLQAFFSMMDSSQVVQEPPKFDLDLYIQNYKGRTRFDRLLHIGRASVPLCVDALKGAVAEAKKGKDIPKYREVWELIRVAAPGEEESTFDRVWVDSTEGTNRAERVRLEAELKQYKNNLIKESIRMGYEDLGRHLESIGDLNGAADAYSKMRPEISTSKQIVDLGRHIVNVSLQRRDWTMVLGNLSKITGMQSTEEEKAIQPYQKILQGIAYIGLEKYHDAAQSFLQTNHVVPSATYSDVATPNDVAIYGGLLALATMSRQDLQSKVLGDTNFRNFLELEPHIRRAITQFISGRYSACLETIESYKPDYLLDIYLHKHVPSIYAQIRSKCIVHYLAPFSRVTIDSLNAAFAAPGMSIEEELIEMIAAGTLQARINTIDKLITTVATDPRQKMQAAALEAARDYEKEALERIRRMSIIAADLEVKGPRKGHGSGNIMGPPADDRLFDELATYG